MKCHDFPVWDNDPASRVQSSTGVGCLRPDFKTALGRVDPVEGAMLAPLGGLRLQARRLNPRAISRSARSAREAQRRSAGMMAGGGGLAVAGGPALHIPVLGRHAVSFLKVRDGGVYIDGTFGAGGYTRAILAAADCKVRSEEHTSELQSL